jgi:hypothetical protein
MSVGESQAWESHGPLEKDWWMVHGDVADPFRPLDESMENGTE